MHRFEALHERRPADPRLRPVGHRPGRRGLRRPRPRRARLGRSSPASTPTCSPSSGPTASTPRPSAWPQSLYAAERAGEPRYAYGRHRLGRLHRARRRSAWTRPSARLAEDGAVRLNALVRRAARRLHRRAVLPQLRLRGVRGRRPRAARRGSPTSRWPAAPACAPRTSAGLRTARPGVGDAGRRRLDPGRAVPGGRRARPRRGPGVPGVRRAGAVGGRRGQGTRGYFEPGTESLQQLRRDRHRRVRVGAMLRERATTRAAGYFRQRGGLTRVEER